jgi:hypothetical protein
MINPISLFFFRYNDSGLSSKQQSQSGLLPDREPVTAIDIGMTAIRRSKPDSVQLKPILGAQLTEAVLS